METVTKNKTCTKCKETKVLELFTKRAISRKDGRDSWCLNCTNEASKTWSRKNPEKIIRKNLMHHYGITLEEKELKAKEQDNLCAVCGKPGKLVVDHSHKSGKFRGLLHHECNTAIGLLRESVAHIQGALNYIMKHSEVV